jgi:hypothetical protein
MSSLPSTDPTPTATGNAATVVGLYEAFGRGDVPAVLAALADDVRWEHWADNTAQRAGVAHLVPCSRTRSCTCGPSTRPAG